MATWNFSDGTRLKSGGAVLGKSAFADALREAIRLKAGVHVFPIPAPPPTPLDPSSNYLLDLFARQMADRANLTVKTAYERDVDDAPAQLREEILAFRRAMDKEPYGRVY
jgi:hypothetical protein